ncbi:MAG: hypothetical protein APR53_10460 [Methanoculleus sp. SDB]|nr:MAG: hypothetical protein APR53_10460 [Methanoculleus sp. SDB]
MMTMPVDRIPIGRFSEVTRLSKKALYCYEKKGLLVPVERDLCTGYRYYTPQQIERGIWIGSLTNLGFSLDDTAMILDARDRDSASVEALMKGRLHETRDEISRLTRVERILSSDDPLKELFTVELENLTIKEIPPIRAMTIRGEGPYGEVLASLIEQICREAFSPENLQNNVKATGPVSSVYIGENCDETGGLVEVALPVSGNVTITTPAITIRTLPAVTAVTVIYRGPYGNLGMAHQKVFEYLQENHLTWTGPARELYLNDPADVPEKDLLTEIQYPISKET